MSRSMFTAQMARRSAGRGARWVACVLASLVCLTLNISPALATDHHPKYDGVLHQRGPFVQKAGEFSFGFDFDPQCPGLDITGHLEGSGVDSVRVLNGSDGQAFLDRQSFDSTEVWKDNRSGDQIFTISAHGLYQEQTAEFVANDQVPADQVPVEGLVGPVYRFTATTTRQGVLTDPTGRALYRDAGTEVDQFLFDTLGDSEPGGRGLGGNVVKVTGIHDLSDVDVCVVAAELLGS